MPLYEYKCDLCEDLVEQRREMDARDTVSRCPSCGRGTLVRKFTNPAVWHPSATGND